jgi:hypothetical protein
MKTRLWLIGLVLLLAIPLGFLLRGFVRDVLLVELLRVIWTIRLLFDSLPQVLVWTVFLLMMLYFALRSLITGRRARRQAYGSFLESVGQVRFLAMRIRSSAQSEYQSWNLARQLAKLATDVLAYSQATTPDRTAWQIRSGKVVAPEEVRTYLQNARAPRSSEPVGFASRLRRLFLPPLEPHRSAPPLDAVVQFLEQKLEE